MSTIVHYVKHWDNDTKGSVEIGAENVLHAIQKASWMLIDDALEDGVDSDSAPAALFTITKAEVVESVQVWTGVPAAGF